MTVRRILRNTPRSRPLPWRRRHRQSGFTLLELLVVMAILMVLSGMLMPLIGEARRSSLRTLTLSIMGKTESALHQYKADFRGYPYQIAYADVDAGQAWTNTLNYQLGTTIAPADAAHVRADMQQAAADYGYTCTSYLNGTGAAVPVRGSVHAFTYNRGDGQSARDYAGDPDSDIAPTSAWQPCLGNGDPTWYLYYDTPSYSVPKSQAVPTCVLLNRMASERASDLMMIGAIQATGVTMPAITYAGLTHPGRDLSGVPLVAAPASSSRPGWANDYLEGQIDAKHLQGSAILDAWFHPLIYVGQVLPGCEPCCGLIFGCSVNCGNPAVYGLQASGRKGLEPCIPGTQVPITGDAYLPDTTNLLHSDRRYWAAPGYELEFELWSAGPDGEFSWWRDDPRNRDDISCEPYDRAIGSQP